MLLWGRFLPMPDRHIALYGCAGRAQERLHGARSQQIRVLGREAQFQELGEELQLHQPRVIVSHSERRHDLFFLLLLFSFSLILSFPSISLYHSFELDFILFLYLFLSP